MRQLPRLDDELTDRQGDGLEPHELLEEVRLGGRRPGAAVPGVEIVRSPPGRASGSPGSSWSTCSCSTSSSSTASSPGAVLAGARFERVVLTRCRMSGLVAAELQAEDVRFDGCQMDQAWLRASRLDRCELVDCDLRGARPLRARGSPGPRSGAAT